MEATKACRIRANLAALAALAALLTGVLLFFADGADACVFFALTVVWGGAEPLAGVDELPELLAETRVAAISTASPPASHRVSRGTEVGEVATLILPL